MGPRLWSQIILNCSPTALWLIRTELGAPPASSVVDGGAPDEDRPVGISIWA